MKRFILQTLLSAFAIGSICAAPPPPPAPPAQLLPYPKALPLALDDNFQFRKTSIWLNDPKLEKPSINEMINFNRQRMNYKAILASDRIARYGYYYTFFWRTKRPANLTIRFEYRQENLGPHVLAQEHAYDGAKGTVKSEFQVIGDDYQTDGRVTSWRALLIENGKIVALNQSFLWD